MVFYILTFFLFFSSNILSMSNLDSVEVRLILPGKLDITVSCEYDLLDCFYKDVKKNFQRYAISYPPYNIVNLEFLEENDFSINSKINIETVKKDLNNAKTILLRLAGQYRRDIPVTLLYNYCYQYFLLKKIERDIALGITDESSKASVEVNKNKKYAWMYNDLGD